MTQKSEPWDLHALDKAAADLRLTDREAPVEMGPAIPMTARQRLVFDAAAAVLRERFDMPAGLMSDGRIVELLAAHALSGGLDRG